MELKRAMVTSDRFDPFTRILCRRTSAATMYKQEKYEGKAVIHRADDQHRDDGCDGHDMASHPEWMINNVLLHARSLYKTLSRMQ